MSREAARQTAEATARASWGRLLSYLAARFRDVAAAEDALSEAFRSALQVWPERGVPERPEAWLLAVARRSLIDEVRHGRVKAQAAPTLDLLAEEAAETSEAAFPDERLKLLFACAHPAVDPAARAPLMLQTVLGMDAARIASAFLVSPKTMGQRLVRAKARIKEAGVRFEVPEREEAPARLASVLEAIYGAYGDAWEDVAGADPRRRGLAEEALWLARVATELLPQEPEAGGLLALILHCEARRAARRSADGRFVPLAEQDTTLWSRAMIVEAERVLAAAAWLGRPGRFQYEAAIQSAHAERAMTGRTNWRGAALLYEGLVAAAPTLGAFVGRAAATGEAFGPERGMKLLEEIPAKLVERYQPYWALMAALLKLLGRSDEAERAYEKAAGLTEDPAVRAFLLEKRVELSPRTRSSYDGSG